jgi:hypothetical protein
MTSAPLDHRGSRGEKALIPNNCEPTQQDADTKQKYPLTQQQIQAVIIRHTTPPASSGSYT